MHSTALIRFSTVEIIMYRVLPSFRVTGFFLAFHLVKSGSTRFYLVLLGFTSILLDSMAFTEFYRVSVYCNRILWGIDGFGSGFRGFYLVFFSTGFFLYSRRPGANERRRGGGRRRRS